MNVMAIIFGRKGKIFTKTLLALVVLAISIIIGLVLSNLNTYLKVEKEKRGQKVAVTAKTKHFNFTYQNITLVSGNYEVTFIPEKEAQKFYQRFKEGIVVYAPKKVLFLTYQGQKLPLIFVDFKEEQKYRRYWNVSGKYPQNPGEVLVGAEIAKEYKLKIGSTISLSEFEGKVTGILKPTGKDEDGFIFASIKEEAAPENYFLIQAILKPDYTEVKNNASTLFPNLEINFLTGPEEQRFSLLQRYQIFGIVLALVLLLMGYLLVKSFFENDLLSRSREVGILEALGLNTKKIIKIILLEDFLTVGLGLLGATPLAYLVAKTLLQRLNIPFTRYIDGFSLIFVLAIITSAGMNYFKLKDIFRIPIVNLLKGSAGE